MVKSLGSFFKRVFNEEFGFVMSMPAVVWQAVFFLLPATVLLLKSVLVYDAISFTLFHYLKCFNWIYFYTILNSLHLAYSTAIFSLLFCFPLVLYINFRIPKKWRATLLFLLMMPSWTNFIIRIYSWFFLLKNDGVLFQFLHAFGFISESSSLLANYFVTQVVMVYCYFPFMLIPLNVAVADIDPKVIEASSDLGANGWQTFWRVILPMSLNGIFSGVVVVLLSSFGEFAIPEFIGGGRYSFWGNLVVSKFLFLSDYHAGGAVMFFGIACLMISMLLFYLILRVFLRLLSNFVVVPEKVLSLKLAQ